MGQPPKEGLATLLQREAAALVEELTSVVEIETGLKVKQAPWRLDIDAQSSSLVVNFIFKQKDEG